MKMRGERNVPEDLHQLRTIVVHRLRGEDPAGVRKAHARPAGRDTRLRPDLPILHVRARGIFGREFYPRETLLAGVLDRIGDQTEILLSIILDWPVEPL